MYNIETIAYLQILMIRYEYEIEERAKFDSDALERGK